MSNKKYSEMTTAQLLSAWESLRERIMAAKAKYDAARGRGERIAPPVSAEDWDAAFSMRRELDKRSNERKPIVNIDFTDKYLTD